MSGALGLLLVALLIVANGLFVAAEFSLVAVRRPLVEERAATGDRRARLVSRELSALSFALSSAQFGITATSLLVGYLAEQAIGDTVIRPLLDLAGLPEQAALGVAITGAFLLSTVVQMVVGELFPKNLAISRPLGVALAVTPFTAAFRWVLGPVIAVLDLAARWLTERLLRVEVAEELPGGHSLDELARIITASSEEGSLTTQQAGLLARAVELGDRRVGEVMVPRPDVVWLHADDSLSDLRDLARRTGHSRFPVHAGSADEVVGTVHVKDLLTTDAGRRSTTRVADVAAPLLVVPESTPLRRLLPDLRREQRTAALVVDEYGSTAGMVTLEDAIEELVGDIEDEFDRRRPPVRRMGPGRTLVEAGLRVDRCGELFGTALPDGPYETLAGFVLDRLGHIPEPGEAVVHDDLELLVTRVEGARITEIVVSHRPAPGHGAGP